MEALDPEPGTIHLRLSRPASIDLEVARRRLEAVDWLGFEVGTDDTPVTASRNSRTPSTRRFETDLGLPLRPGSQRTIFRKAALVDLGVPQMTAEGLRVPIAWRSATMAPLFPVFAGWLDVVRDALVLDGWYAPPGGAAGVVVDRAFLNLAARGTARWFLDRIGEAIELGAPAGSPAGQRPGLEAPDGTRDEERQGAR